jgi:hypothetical protein
LLEQIAFLTPNEKKRSGCLLVSRSRPMLVFIILSVVLIFVGMLLIGLGFGRVATAQATYSMSLYPPVQWVGWVASSDLRGNHLGDSALYAGDSNHVTHYGLVRFDVWEIAGAPLHSAILRLSGLSSEWLGDGGTWTVELLESDPGDLLSDEATFKEIKKAAAVPGFFFTVESSDLGAGIINELRFTDEQVAVLEERAARTGRLTFRLSGPADEKNALFAWDSGYGLGSDGTRPELVMTSFAPVGTSPDAAQFVAQSVPAQMEVDQSHTVRLVMRNSGTSTWYPEGQFAYVLGRRSSQAKETWGSKEAILPREVGPGQNVEISFSIKAPSEPGAYEFQWQMLHNEVGWFGDTTNKMIVQVVAPAPSPTATSTPISVPFPDPTMTPAPTATSMPNWSTIPPEWKGRIAFISDRDSGKEAYYVMDADGTNVEKLSGPDLYEAALYRDTLDPSGEYEAFVSMPRGASRDEHVGKNYEISLRRLSDGYEWYLTGGTKGSDYQPAYCQANPRYIVYTSQQTYNDDIFVVDILSPDEPPRTTRLTENPPTQDWVWDKHPSWSPNCEQVVFYSNRTGKDQIWVMDFWSMDFVGQNPRQISNGKYNDWDPVWIK